MIPNNIYAKPNIAALVQLQLSVEEVEGLQFCLNRALDEMSDWKGEMPEDASIDSGMAILYGLHETLGRVLKGAQDGR